MKQLKSSSKTISQIIIDTLKTADAYGHKSYRKVNYHDT